MLWGVQYRLNEYSHNHCIILIMLGRRTDPYVSLLKKAIHVLGR